MLMLMAAVMAFLVAVISADEAIVTFTFIADIAPLIDA